MRTEAAQNFEVVPTSCGRAGFALLLLLAMLPEASSAWAQHQAELVVATREVPPFAIRTDKGWEGIAIELWTRVATLPRSTSESFLSRPATAASELPRDGKQLCGLAGRPG